MNVTEPQVERLLSQLQQVVERSPVHLRPKRRQIMRGMRCALSAVADGVSLDGLCNELVYELTGIVPDKPVTQRLGTPAPLSQRDAEIIQCLDNGMSIAAITRKVGCSAHTVGRCKILRDERDQWESNCATLAQHEVMK